ncbi:Rrf2 family transcriptional regulator [Elizabethkingia sp. HX WHF]|jgi:Rrf2 family protein|uniref:Rrf2 family transcriptional regulator n=3 Tax=Elizabethkingia TaxID=308865 RepID=A0AAQ1PJ41_ELIMR|nr:MULTISPECIES: Rrf2 family transcriptional regulator [Elizabethkingia]AJW64805.1 HTH-type transcriptional regulator CymR [Elizabethkingia miricola]ATL43799.1 Rrf2 family transcriptional regulator [Elizabethkingia miricola]MCL1637752.1 Rrf2 family transcriptional regulator [Elizabethkingia bruuniana]MCL1654692.1 Rrf2 family transcriptional regulator [Elizabethkingia miricola]MCL1655414.1 Rrf2 family transcriptional regulator [Elizabethkingia miricola]
MMSKRCKYALKAMVRLARNYKNGFLSTAIIAQEENIPKKFLEQILLELKRAKLVNSKQGIGGGYYLLKSPDEVSLADLYRIFEGPISLTPCISLNYYEACDDCVDEEACYLRHELINVREKTRKSMMEATLTAFMNRK